MNYSVIKPLDIANGPGCRVSIWFTGCKFHCKGCFNSDIWDFNSGELFTREVVEDILDKLSKPFVKGLSILGGEPFHQKNYELLPFVREVKTRYPNKTIWIWTGYELEELMNNQEALMVLEYADVVVTGRFQEENSHAHHRFRGSSNQRIYKVDGCHFEDISEIIDNGRL